MTRTSAVIFDMDGVLIDSEPLHLVAANEILAPCGHRLTEEENTRYLGWNEPAFWGDLVRRYSLPDSVDSYIEARHVVLVRLLRERLPIMDGVADFIAGVRSGGRRTAVASSSQRELIDFVLEGGGLTSLFDAVASGDEVARPKPDPEIFLLAAERLGVAPEACLVFEDSRAGIEAARAAGMRCARVTTTTTRDLEFPAVDAVIESFRGLELQEVL